ncbi:MAG: polyribonucleotide nucleotidyltransferase [Acidobacteria bacterium]|nr:polyribonucleotide nucleotidyltransferase [Acidobacteriota bacterium]MCH7985408.1 polyribonucleotide nucleotidyltransferase [Acidobacteriota bacterium]
MTKQVVIDIGGRPLTIETGRLAKQANGSVQVRFGDTVVLVTACIQTEPRQGLDFFPLTCEYREYQYAAGRIPGGFFKREGRPSEKEIVTCRLMDRPLRPLFPKGFRNETQVIAMVLSADTDNDPDVIALVGASAAFYISDIPFFTPIASVRVGLVDGALVANPTYAQQVDSLLNIVVAGSKEAIVMVEAGAAEVTEETILDALQFAHEQIRKIVAGIEELHGQIQPKKWEVAEPEVNQEYYQQIASQYGQRLADACNTEKHSKKESHQLVTALKKELAESIPEEEEDRRKEASRYFSTLREEIFRRDVLENKRRPDGRAFDKVRAISCEVGVLPRTHGSALFTRGETQALVTATLGTKEDVQRLDLLAEEDAKKKFMLHYNFPPFSVGEVKFLRGPGRREIGHGALAERALRKGMPSEDDFPYTVRVVSDILESNGSSSMATVCGGSLALMDAGVPVKDQVAGIAMGLVMGEGGKYGILTDIAGAEDHYGDMDFKVAGTAKGITALQMDIKVGGVTSAILSEALQQAKKARLEILDIMNQTLSKPREAISPYAPHIFTLTIPRDKIGGLIGPGGKVIRGIVEATGAKIDVMDDGKVNVFAVDEEAAKQAMQMVQDVTATAEVGKTYLGKVVRLVDFGAFVEIFPGTDGLLHISEIAEQRIRDVRDELKEGDQVMVKVLTVEGNKIRLSRKAVLREQRAKERSGAS